MVNEENEPLSRKTYLTIQVMAETGCGVFAALKAVASMAVEHPEWNMGEMRPWRDWVADGG